MDGASPIFCGEPAPQTVIISSTVAPDYGTKTDLRLLGRGLRHSEQDMRHNAGKPAPVAAATNISLLQILFPWLLPLDFQDDFDSMTLSAVPPSLRLRRVVPLRPFIGPTFQRLDRVVPLRPFIGPTLSSSSQGGAAEAAFRSHPLFGSAGWGRNAPWCSLPQSLMRGWAIRPTLR
jgi:hypothetical protein